MQTLTATPFEGLYIIEILPIKDFRGSFERLFDSEILAKSDLASVFPHENRSSSFQRGTIRGFHYQLPPYSEIKLIRCERGAIYDVCIDIRKNSKSFMKSFEYVLKHDDNKMIYIPAGFAHAYQALEDNSVASYKSSSPYKREFERQISHMDPIISVNWPIKDCILSSKDLEAPHLEDTFTGIAY